MDENSLAALLEIAGNLSMSAILLYLLVSERQAHDKTRDQYRLDMLKLFDKITRTPPPPDDV